MKTAQGQQLTTALSLPTGSQESLAELAGPFKRHLEAGNKRPRTAQGYLESLAAFRSFLESPGLSGAVGSLRRDHVEAFLADLLTRAKPSTALVASRLAAVLQVGARRRVGRPLADGEDAAA
ncbi:MAG: phage integrase N-terminal SAM-like domain-containing protein [Terriglobales bacterium]